MRHKPKVIGLYGVSGCGKTLIMNELQKIMSSDELKHYKFYEGSEVIDLVTPGGITAFKDMTPGAKTLCRERATGRIQREARASGTVAVVTGHGLLWDETEKSLEYVLNTVDAETYSHIIYLDVPCDAVMVRRGEDKEKTREEISLEGLIEWQSAEERYLLQFCRERGIVFLSMSSPTPAKVASMLQIFRESNEESSLALAKARLNAMFEPIRQRHPLQTMLVIDGDKTLCREDTGTLFWDLADQNHYFGVAPHEALLDTLFESTMGYSHTAFLQAMCMYEWVPDFDLHCKTVANIITLAPEFLDLLNEVSQHEHVGVVVVTSGLQKVWEEITSNAGINVVVIGSGRFSDQDLVITPAVQAGLVKEMNEVWKVRTWAFGESPLDLPMLKEAHQAIVVVGNQPYRSQSMDQALLHAIENEGLRARQVILLDNLTSLFNDNSGSLLVDDLLELSQSFVRLDMEKLPAMELQNKTFLDFLLWNTFPKVSFLTDTAAAKLLMTPTRDARCTGPPLRAAHFNIGWYLAMYEVTGIIGVEEYEIPHVQGFSVSGYRLFEEDKTCIVPLMRGGEPMALGINDAFPLASLVHARVPQDLRYEHVRGKETMLLVDSVVNSGKTMVEFLEHVERLRPGMRIIIVAGVVQEQAISAATPASNEDRDYPCIRFGEDFEIPWDPTLFSPVGQKLRGVRNTLHYRLHRYPNVHLVALRSSGNRFTGQGGTDTGNRLFNTTNLGGGGGGSVGATAHALLDAMSESSPDLS